MLDTPPGLRQHDDSQLVVLLTQIVATVLRQLTDRNPRPDSRRVGDALASWGAVGRATAVDE